MDTIKFPFDVISAYFSSGYILYIFIVCMIYLWFREKEKTNRFILVYVMTGMLCIFVFPLFTYIAVRTIFNAETYYRIIWTMPIYIVIAYTFTKIYSAVKNKYIKYLSLIVMMIIISFCGDFTYNHPTFVKAENEYHIPQSIVMVSDVIEEDSKNNPREKTNFTRAVMPIEFLESIRQYSPKIRMPYGRNAMVERWNISHPIYEIMQEDVLDIEELTKEARNYVCAYIVINAQKPRNGEFEDYYYEGSAYELIDRVGVYSIYCNSWVRDHMY